jgi:hypothetical protein
MVLLTVVDVTVLLVVPGPAPRASVSHDHDQRIDLWGSRVLENFGLDRRRALHESHHQRADGIEPLGQGGGLGLQLCLEELKGHLCIGHVGCRVSEDLAVVRPRAENRNFHLSR